MALDQLSSNDKQKLRDLIDSGVRVLQEVQDLKDGLKDTVKNVADELDIKPTILNKVIKHAYKSTLQEEKEEMETVETILDAVRP